MVWWWSPCPASQSSDLLGYDTLSIRALGHTWCWGHLRSHGHLLVGNKLYISCSQYWHLGMLVVAMGDIITPLNMMKHVHTSGGGKMGVAALCCWLTDSNGFPTDDMTQWRAYKKHTHTHTYTTHIHTHYTTHTHSHTHELDSATTTVNSFGNKA